jgi:iron complex outermembrane receptor protein
MRQHIAGSLGCLTLLAASLPIAAPAAEDQTEELEAVVVTGTRIARAIEDTPNPVTSYDAANIEQSGLTNLTDLLIQAPPLVASESKTDNSGSEAAIGTAGLNLLDLRNLGVERTLVLVNARRHVASLPGNAAVDINTIPIDLIERVDVLTGGVSAIYGADGVSGVVNFVTKRDFEGLAIRAQSGLSGQGDTGNDFISITGGQNFAGGAGNVALAFEYNKDDRVTGFDRARTGDPLRSFSIVRNPDDFPDDPDVFDRIPLNDLRYDGSSRNGAIDVDWDFGADFTGDGSPYDNGLALPQSGGLAQGGSSTPVAGYQGDLQAKTDRYSLNLLSGYEFSDAMRFFVEGKYVQARAWNTSQPNYDFFAYVNAANPLIPDVIRDAIVPGAAGDYGFDEDGLMITRDNFDFGVRGDRVKRETLRSVVGLDGRLMDDMKYEGAQRGYELAYRGTLLCRTGCGRRRRIPHGHAQWQRQVPHRSAARGHGDQPREHLLGELRSWQ